MIDHGIRFSLARGLPTAALLALSLHPGSGDVSAQAVEETMVPRGRVRFQAFVKFEAWDQRFGRLPDGSEPLERLGDDLTDPTSLSLFPGMPTLQEIVRDVTGDAAYTPVMGSTDGRITQDLTGVDWGIDVGVLDWLTVGAVLPWVRPRTVVDVFFAPDSLGGNVGLNPMVTAPTSVTTFLGSTLAADASATANATSICSGGLTPECATAQALAQRAREFNTSVQSAYGATPFFPLSSSTAGMALDQAALALSADLMAAGLTGLAAMALATDLLTTEGFPLLPAVPGTGIEATPLQTRPGIYSPGDLRLTARVRLLDNLTPRWTGPQPRNETAVARTDVARTDVARTDAARTDAARTNTARVERDMGDQSTPNQGSPSGNEAGGLGETDSSTEGGASQEFVEPREGAVRARDGGIGYRVTASFMAQLPTGTVEHPDVLLDIGAGNGNSAFEGGLFATVLFGRRFGLSAGGRYAVQGSASLIKRVAPPELVMPPVLTRTDVIWTPGFYVSFEAAPTLHISNALAIIGEYRFFHKGLDKVELLSSNPNLDPMVLSIESGIKMHQVGVGLRYDTVTPWMLGEAPRAMEMHLRLLTTIAGSGGQAPKSTRVEAGLRLFRRFWGPQR